MQQLNNISLTFNINFFNYLKLFTYLKSIYYLHVGDDDEITVVELVEVEFVDEDNDGTGGLDIVGSVELILITISIKYIYIIKKIYFYFFTIT